jgi:hypothetical protein
MTDDTTRKLVRSEPAPQSKPPRPCQFCGSRFLANMDPGMTLTLHQYRVICQYCKAEGPKRELQDEAWSAWNGDMMKAPENFGQPEGA